MTKLVPGSFLYNILYGNTNKVVEKEPFYVQNSEDYVRLLKKNYDYYGVPFKQPNVEEIPPYEKVDDTIESHIEHLDQLKVKLNVLKSGKVRVKVIPHMAVLNEKYYSKYKIPPIKSVISALKALGYSHEFMDTIMEKYKNRNQLIEKRWKILEKKFDAPSVASRNKKKKMDKKTEAEAEAEAEAEVRADSEDDEPKEKKDDEPEEDEAIIIDEDGDEEEVIEDDYVSDGGDD